VNLARRTSWLDIREELSRRIVSREWKPGGIIPGEETLASEFGVARATVNRALQDLARAGLLERKRKAGTRVTQYPVREARFAIPLVRHEVEAKGATYGYTLLTREITKTPGIVRARLGLAGEARMLHLRCLHTADRAPYQYEDRWINLETVPGAASEPFQAVGPNEWLVEHAPFSRAEFAFFAAAATAEEAALLGLEPGAPVFVGERLTWLAEAPVTLVRMVHPPTHRMVTHI
jgi:GntR family transcriptional regulator, histidine utilization repressor